MTPKNQRQSLDETQLLPFSDIPTVAFDDTGSRTPFPFTEIVSSGPTESTPTDTPAPALADPATSEDPVLKSKEAPLSASVAPSHSAEPTPGLAMLENGSDAPRYESTKIIGRGGYGVVWSGSQLGLRRRVALKTLTAEARQSPHRNRLAHAFRQEAITTAHLQHPHVTPVYDLVSDSDGIPIVVMKLMEGRQWNQVLAFDFASMAPLEFLEVHLPVLISVAQAVAFAHSRGIIHRDLKPSQVMLASYGEVLLMDWGLAMAARDPDGEILCDSDIVLDDDSPLLKPLMPAGSPGYMAPEQLGRDISRLGPWTDVYLLGAILYELLTGERPGCKFSDDPANAEAGIQEPAKPEKLCPDRDIPAQLSAVAMKALSLRPSRRLASATQFAQEIKSYLGKASRRGESMELVTDVANTVLEEQLDYEQLQRCLDKLDRALAAWPDNHMASYLRQQTLITFARTALEHGDLILAQLQAERIQATPEKKALLLEIESVQADEERRKTDARNAFNRIKQDRARAEGLFRFLLKDLHDELAAVGRPDLVYKVATQALEFYDSLVDETNASVLQSRCMAFLQIGDVLNRQARRMDAESAYERAREVAQSILSEEPENTVVLKLLGRCLGSIGELRLFMGDLTAAGINLQHALESYSAAFAHAPRDYEAQRCLGRTEHDLSRVAWRKQNFTGAMEHISTALQVARDLEASSPRKTEAQADLADYLGIMASYQRDMGNPDSALQTLYEALSIKIALMEQDPANKQRAQDVYWSRANLAQVLMAQGQVEAALSNLRLDLPSRRKAYEEDNQTVIYAIGLTFHLSVYAEAQYLLGRVDEAEQILSECLVYSQSLAQTDNTNPTVISRLGIHLAQLAELRASQGRWPEAEVLAVQSLEKARYAMWLAPGHGAVIQPLIRALAVMARCLEKRGQGLQSAQHRSEAMELMQTVKADPNSTALLALQARVALADIAPSDRDALVRRLQEVNHLDPYLAGWHKELELHRQA